ncbi:GDCCVxC domain-containing (seleno)protein [Imperialibacter roseus]|uniref:GDCCVxC domain-containing (seleno)protein n=1 Tax=Imperialibacter roseus TaxID=1324217 RepID=UPI00374F2774
MPKIQTEAILECPSCHSKYRVQMPQRGKHLNSRCVFCGEVYSIKSEDECCVYCQYSNLLCPAKQKINSKNK